jgi:peptidoglycan/xylan/chitin deacetylase (PgdA/CDA1 family)
MKRRKIIKLGSCSLITLSSCSSRNKKGNKKSLGGSDPAKVGANPHYQTPGYAQPGMRNPNMNLPSQFGASAISYSSGVKTTPYVAMTFDDGPHPQNTPRLLDMLRVRNIRATFFVIGNNVDRYPHIARRIVAEGHEIGNHTYTHRKLTTLDDREVIKELEKTEQSIIKATGVKPRTMRPPYGALSPRQRQLVYSNLHYPTILWSVDPQDWKRPGPSVVTSRILSKTESGSIILAHDLHAPTVDAMPQTFDGILSRGFQFITVSQMIAQKNQV